MHYKLIIVDNNTWMYTDMALQIITQLSEAGHTAEMSTIVSHNSDDVTHVFLGTAYNRIVQVPPGSIVTNFDNDTHLFNILTPTIIQTCTIWDYSQENLDLIRQRYPEAVCHLFEMGYSPLLDHHLTYEESQKDIDVLLLGVETERRSKILNRLREDGYNVVAAYRKIGAERVELLRRTKIAVSIYGYDHTHCISASRFTPILCNNGFIVTENCSNKEKNHRWSQYTVSVDYDQVYDTIVEYLGKPEKRREMADKFYQEFKQTRSKVID